VPVRPPPFTDMVRGVKEASVRPHLRARSGTLGTVASVATRSTVNRTPVRRSVGADIRPLRGEQLLLPANLANARLLGSHTCSCVRSPRAIAHWLLVDADPTADPTDLALDREEAALWSHTLTGRLRIEHSATDGVCAISLRYSDGRIITIAMDELRLAAVSAV